MKTTYKQNIASPFQVAQKKVPTMPVNHPAVIEEIQKNLNTHVFTATFKEDMETLNALKRPGVVAFVCELKRGSEIVAYGRGMSVLNRMNKYIERTVRTAFNSSLINAIIQSTKVIDTLSVSTSEPTSGQQYMLEENRLPEPASEKQKAYLVQLVQKNVSDEREREQWELEIDGFTKEEASEHINSFLEQSDNNY